MIVVRGANGTALIQLRRRRDADVFQWRILNGPLQGQIRRDTEPHFQADFIAMMQAAITLTGQPQILTDIAELT